MMYDPELSGQIMGRMDEAFGPVQKQPKQSVNYRESEDEARSCLTCPNFMGEDNTCRVVDGNVSAGGVCDEWTDGETSDGDFDDEL